MANQPDILRFSLTDLSGLDAAAFDTVIDVRSPSEFAIDRVPGAISLPVLDDDERARVGTIYTQDSPFRARKVGAAIVAKNAAHHIETALADKPGAWRPLVYCWRGGQRSGAFASILEQIGWRVAILEGGYQSWRRHVVARLYHDTLPFRLVRLDGFTGTGKTDVLHRVAALGGQVIDLEGLACHRGSILGGQAADQPVQKAFETSLVAAFARLDPTRPVLVEAESARIGALRLPPALWGGMKASDRIVLTSPRAARARHLAAGYGGLLDDPLALRRTLDRLRELVGGAQVSDWAAMIDAGAAEDLAASLIEGHYDPAYTRARRAEEGAEIAQIALADMTPTDLDTAAQAVLDRMRAL